MLIPVASSHFVTSPTSPTRSTRLRIRLSTIVILRHRLSAAPFRRSRKNGRPLPRSAHFPFLDPSINDLFIVFADLRRLTVVDTRHTTEIRENTTGLVAEVLVVTATHPDRNGVTRLISARPARRQERNRYYAHD